MTNFFSDLLTKGARVILPESLEYKFGITSKPMEFPVGEGLTSEQTKKAQEVITKKTIPLKEKNFFADVVRAFPRAGARVGVEIGKKIIGAETAEIQPKTGFERLVFGDEPIKDIPAYGKETLQQFGVSEEKAKKYGLFAGIVLTALDLSWGGGKSGIAKTIVRTATMKEAESVIKKLGVNYSDDLAKRIINTKTTQEATKLIDDLARIKSITPKLQPLAQEARKYKSAEEFVKAQGFSSSKKGDTTIFRDKIGNEVNVRMTESNNRFGLNYIQVDKIDQRGTGLGSKIINAFKEYADKTGKTFQVGDVTNQKFFDKFSFLKKPQGLDTVRIYSAGEDVLSSLENKISSIEKQIGTITERTGKTLSTYNPATGKIAETPFGKQVSELEKLQKARYDFISGKTSKSQLTDFYNQAVKEGKEMAELNLSRTPLKELDQTKTFVIYENGKWYGHHIGDKTTARKLVDKLNTTKEGSFQYKRMAEEVEGGIIPPTPKVLPAVQEEFGQAAKLSQLTPEPKIPKPLKQEILTSETLTKPYTETTKKAIIDTAEAVEEHPTIVSRVADSLRKAKTSLVEYVQNADIRVRQLTEKKGIKIDDVSDPYLKMTLYPGRVGTKVENLKTEAKGIIDMMKKTANELKTDLGTIKKDVSDYLKFRHAPERNLALGEKAAGITTKEAQEGLKRIETSANGKKVKEIADKLQKINDQTLDILKESGVISDDLYKTLRTKYKYHIPLNRIFEETDDIGSVLSGRGFDVRATGIKAAKGSEREVADIMTNILTNQEQAIIRAEKNIVDQSTLAFTRQNKDILGDLMTEIKPQAIGKTFEGKPLLERTQDPTILQLFENGKRVWIKIKNPELAIALRGVGREKLGTMLNAVAKFTRLYSGLATRFNPEFFLPNKIRDLQETAVYLTSQKGMGFKGATTALRKDPASIKDVINVFRGIDNEGTRLYKEMRELGGTTGGMGLSTRKQVELNLEQLEKLANSKTRQIGNKLVEYIDDWNTIFEDSTRLSVYKSALKQGLSKDRAAFLAKEASINFNRMGKGGPVINALWMFSNASIQGSVKMIRSLKNPKVLGATVAVVGGAVATINEFNDQADEKWRDKVSKWDRLNGMPIVIPSTDGEFRYITIPVSWGLKPIKVLSEYAYDAISGNEFNAKNMIEDSITAIADAYNPTGGTDITSALVPTILDVPVDITRNRSWSGIKIRPDTDPNAPRDVQYFQSLGKTKIGRGAISISETLQDKLGLAISPADIKYAFDQYISGAGRTVGKFTNLIASATDDEPLPLDEYPLISRFYRERTAEEVGAGAGEETEDIKKILQEQSRERFTIKQQSQELDKELLKLSPTEANARFKQIKKENPELAEKLKDIISERKLGLTYTEKLMKQLGVENGERAKYIDEQIMKLPTREERNAYYQELRKKKIISDEVAKQIKKLKR